MASMRLCTLKSWSLVFTVEGNEWEVNITLFAEESFFLQKVALLV